MLYLGTEPPKQTIAFSEARPMDYAAMEQERLALLSKLKAAGGAAGLDAAAAAKAEAKGSSSLAPLVLKVKVPNRLDSADTGSISGAFGSGLGSGFGQQGQQQQLTVALTLSNNTTGALQVWPRQLLPDQGHLLGQQIACALQTHTCKGVGLTHAASRRRLPYCHTAMVVRWNMLPVYAVCRICPSVCWCLLLLRRLKHSLVYLSSLQRAGVQQQHLCSWCFNTLAAALIHRATCLPATLHR